MSLSQSGARPQSDLLGSQEAHVKRVLGGLSTIVRDNSASGHGVLFAGPVAEKVSNNYAVNYNFNLFVGSNTCCLTGNSSPHDVPTRPRSATTPHGLPHRISLAQSASQAPPIPPLKPKPVIRSKQFVTIHSKTNDPHVIRAQLRSEIQQNWISPRIVSGLKLESHIDVSVANAEYDGTPLRSSGKFVVLYRSSDRSAMPCQQRFHVVCDGASDKFDMLLGADILFPGEEMN